MHHMLIAASTLASLRLAEPVCNVSGDAQRSAGLAHTDRYCARPLPLHQFDFFALTLLLSRGLRNPRDPYAYVNTSSLHGSGSVRSPPPPGRLASDFARRSCSLTV